MSVAFIVCAACACHIKAAESVCPFCASPQPRRMPVPMPWAGARWLGVGTALAALSCGGRDTPPLGADGQGTNTSTKSSTSGHSGTTSHDHDAALADAHVQHNHHPDAHAVKDAGHKADVSQGDDAGQDGSVVADAHAIPCGQDAGTVCGHSSEVCVDLDGVSASCLPKPACDAYNICQCLIPDASPSCSCYAEEDGGMINCISHTCYGSPPPRVRRSLLVA